MNPELDNLFGGEDGVSPIRFGLRDADRVAHHYADEVFQPYEWEPWEPTWSDHARDVAQIIAYGFATVVATFVVWSLLVALLLGGAK